jgi:hypothetical protein
VQPESRRPCFDALWYAHGRALAVPGDESFPCTDPTASFRYDGHDKATLGYPHAGVEVAGPLELQPVLSAEIAEGLAADELARARWRRQVFVPTLAFENPAGFAMNDGVKFGGRRVARGTYVHTVNGIDADGDGL